MEASVRCAVETGRWTQRMGPMMSVKWQTPTTVQPMVPARHWAGAVLCHLVTPQSRLIGVIKSFCGPGTLEPQLDEFCLK